MSIYSLDVVAPQTPFLLSRQIWIIFSSHSHLQSQAPLEIQRRITTQFKHLQSAFQPHHARTYARKKKPSNNISSRQTKTKAFLLFSRSRSLASFQSTKLSKNLTSIQKYLERSRMSLIFCIVPSCEHCVSIYFTQDIGSASGCGSFCCLFEKKDLLDEVSFFFLLRAPGMESGDETLRGSMSILWGSREGLLFSMPTFVQSQ